MSKVKNEKSLIEAKPKNNLMYLGPTIPGVVRHSTVFKAGVLTNKVTKCISEYPIMSKLFVSVDNLAIGIRELNNKESVLSKIYAQVKNKFM